MMMRDSPCLQALLISCFAINTTDGKKEKFTNMISISLIFSSSNTDIRHDSPRGQPLPPPTVQKKFIRKGEIAGNPD